MKKSFIIISVVICLLFTSCIPPFFENVIETQECLGLLEYQTYVVDYAEEKGYRIVREDVGESYVYGDYDDNNAFWDSYKQLSFKIKKTQKIRTIVFLIEANKDCLVKLLIKNGEEEVAFLELELKKEIKEWINLVDIHIEFKEGEKLIFSVENPTELVETSTRFDTLVLVGE